MIPTPPDQNESRPAAASSVQLRPVIETDLPIFFDQQLDEEANRMAAFTSPDPSDREAFMARWRKILADKTLVVRTIVVEGEVAGSILCHRWFGPPEISYWLGRPFWGRGIATEALRRLLALLPERPLYAMVAQDNIASRRVLEKCGFVIAREEHEFSHARGEVVGQWFLALGLEEVAADQNLEMALVSAETAGEDRSVDSVLAALGTTHGEQLGQGGEAQVFALDDQRVARIGWPGGTRSAAEQRAELLSELGRSAGRVPFAIPEVLDIQTVGARVVTIERRLPGRPLMAMLESISGLRRERLIVSYLETAARLGDLVLERPWVGEVFPGGVRADTFREYLAARAARSLAASGWPEGWVDPAALVSGWPEPETMALVHLDAFPGNMLAEGETVTAVLDFGYSALVGDRRLDPLSAAVYLEEAITPPATAGDRALAGEWLVGRGLSALFVAARRWLAAYWSFAADDRRLHAWCRAVLAGSP